ncbi:MAG TPA: hypothetical protein VD970_16210 [Acetobacteraceae bacterium]|nr:hypothetical protein [Acetobacteraceae bacterium]
MQAPAPDTAGPGGAGLSLDDPQAERPAAGSRDHGVHPVAAVRMQGDGRSGNEIRRAFNPRPVVGKLRNAHRTLWPARRIEAGRDVHGAPALVPAIRFRCCRPGDPHQRASQLAHGFARLLRRAVQVAQPALGLGHAAAHLRRARRHLLRGARTAGDGAGDVVRGLGLLLHG